MSEQFLIVVLYHIEGFKNFRYYYKYAVEIKYKSLFKEAPRYNRFIHIMPKLLVALSILTQCLFGKARGIYFLDATKLSPVILEGKEETKFSERLQKKAKLLWVGFLGSSCM